MSWKKLISGTGNHYQLGLEYCYRSNANVLNNLYLVINFSIIVFVWILCVVIQMKAICLCWCALLSFLQKEIADLNATRLKILGGKSLWMNSSAPVKITDAYLVYFVMCMFHALLICTFSNLPIKKKSLIWMLLLPKLLGNNSSIAKDHQMHEISIEWGRVSRSWIWPYNITQWPI